MDSATGLWERAKTHIRSELTEISFNTWIKPVRAVSLDQGVLRLEVPTDFVKNTLETRYLDLINDSLSLFMEGCAATVYSADEKKKAVSTAEKPVYEESRTHILNPRYTFETFVVGENNKFARAASMAVADSPGKSYNPLYIYGGTGLGKTHLMHAIGNHVLANNPRANVMYVTTERFTNEMIAAITNNSTDSSSFDKFRKKYREVDLLLIDDIQFLANKDRTQEEFFHTFNTLHGQEKQLVISSDKQPDEIPSIEDRLRSRFEWGLIADIQPPDYETRVAILLKKAQLEALDVDDDVLHFIASCVESNIRKLEGSLSRVKQYSVLTGRRITLDTAREALKDLAPGQGKKQVTSADIRKAVCEFYNIRPEDLSSQRRNRDLAYPRQVAMYLLREMTGMSLPKIGEFFGGRDHTTVMHACEKISQEAKKSGELRSMIEDIKKKIAE